MVGVVITTILIVKIVEPTVYTHLHNQKSSQTGYPIIYEAYIVHPKKTLYFSLPQQIFLSRTLTFMRQSCSVFEFHHKTQLQVIRK